MQYTGSEVAKYNIPEASDLLYALRADIRCNLKLQRRCFIAESSVSSEKADYYTYKQLRIPL